MDFSKYKSEDLAAQVVLYRALKINKENSINCMIELAKRRELGEVFDYETYIEKHVAEIPIPNKMNIFNLIKDIK